MGLFAYFFSNEIIRCCYPSVCYSNIGRPQSRRGAVIHFRQACDCH